jgi:Glycosyl transferase family 2
MHQVSYLFPSTVDLVDNSDAFDADWYLAAYPDVALTGLPPAAHFAEFGWRLGRRPGEAVGDEAAGRLSAALGRRPAISYCIPIMNRPDDIRLTLAANLEANRAAAAEIEFIVLFYDTDAETHDWVRGTFADDLTTGYLRLIVTDPLDRWHFGRAKNGFRPFMRGAVYSSLDGDNYVTLEETEQLLDLHRSSPGLFAFHQFSGDWGDGTSGRISVSRRLYYDVGYDTNFLPRQFDENDFLISALVRYPEAAFYRYETRDHVFSTKRGMPFLEARPALAARAQTLPPVHRIAAANPRGADYVAESSEFGAMLYFNQSICYWRNSVDKMRSHYMRQVLAARHQLVDAIAPDRLLPMVLDLVRHVDAPPLGERDVAVFMVVKNDNEFLPLIYDHYKARGVRHFFIVDDHSDVPVAEVLPYADVSVFAPRAGGFATGKGMWLDVLSRRFLPDRGWAMMIDADEFVDLPTGVASFPALAEVAEAQGLEHIPALMIDMVPSRQVEADSFVELFSALDSFGAVAGPPSPDYSHHHSVKWAFGDRAAYAWGIDVRYHAFGTIDTLRKIPMFRVRAHQHPNQGFHELHFTDGTPSPGTAVWDLPIILPMRHYKTLKLFSADLHARTRVYVGTRGAEYHSRTSENISKIFGEDRASTADTLMAVPNCRYSPAVFEQMLAGWRTDADGELSAA